MIGRYRVRKYVASGGMAEIYLADYDDRGVTRQAVVKVILRERARDRKFVQMFLDEARVSSTFIHPHIGQLYEVGRDADTYFYAMEFVDGENVRALIERSLRRKVYMPQAVTLAIGTRVASALHYAHERASSSGQLLNAVHRDVTPSNIMLGFDGAVKLLDFGIARADSRAQMTQSGTVKGKFAYMSPEQCRGKQVDRRTDVFALGIVLYELSTQRRAFRAETDFDTMERIVRGDLVPPRQIHADYPAALEAILLRALALEPGDRYQTAAEFGHALATYQRGLGLPTDEGPVVAIMRQLFIAEPLPDTAAGVETVSVPPPVMPRPSRSLASMLALAEPAAPAPTPAWSRPPRTQPIAPPMAGAPAAMNPAMAEIPAGDRPFGSAPSVSIAVVIHAPPVATELEVSTQSPEDAAATARFAPTVSAAPAEPSSVAIGTPPARRRISTSDVVAADFAATGPMAALTDPGDARRSTADQVAIVDVGAQARERRGLWLALAAIAGVTAVVAAVLLFM